MFSIKIDLLPKTLYIYLDKTGKRIVLFVPDALGNLFAPHHLFGFTSQTFQECIFLGGQFDQALISSYLMGPCINLEVVNFQYWIQQSGRAAEQRTNASHQFVEMERLREVIVGASIQSLNAVGDVIQSGEHEYRDADAGASQLGTNLKT